MRESRMRGRTVFSGAILAGLVVLSACGGGEPRLMNATKAGAGPDEFAILPYRALEIPDNLNDLPPPAPGGRNRADADPEADAVAALGGDPARVPGTTPPDADSALLAQAGRFGLAPDIRATLAAEDLAFRRANQGRLLERVFDVNVYYDAYAPLSLDQEAALRRWRERGVRTPAAPPPPAVAR